MARRNRKHEVHGSRAVCWGIAVILVLAVGAMVYLSLYNSCERIGRRIKGLEQEYATLQKKVVNEERNWAMARSIRNMERLMETHGIVMTWPEEKNIIRLKPVASEEPAQYACQRSERLRD